MPGPLEGKQKNMPTTPSLPCHRRHYNLIFHAAENLVKNNVTVLPNVHKECDHSDAEAKQKLP